MPRQTKTFLIERFREMGIAPATRHGQNFLIDLNLQQLIVNAADIGPRDVVLEVGTGTGALTAQMADRAAAVVTVEIDHHLFEFASEELFERPNVTMLHFDALRNKHNFDDRVVAAVAEQMASSAAFAVQAGGESAVQHCDAGDFEFAVLGARAVLDDVTIQKELADRITAAPSTKDYGALSIWIQSQCKAELVRLMSPQVFWPSPKVTSAVIRLTIEPERRAAIGDLRYFHDFTRMIFLHRRKFLRANVVAAMKEHLDKGQVDEVLNAMGFAADTRTEQLDVETLLKLADKVRAAAPEWTL